MHISKDAIIEISKEDNLSRFDDDLFFHELDERLGLLNIFSTIKLIGEINRAEGEQTYNALKDCLKNFFQRRNINEFIPNLIDTKEYRKSYRAVLSLYFVWTGIFKYGEEKGKEIWPHVFEGLGFTYNPNISGDCGKMFDKFLKENDLEQFRKLKSKLRYVDRILLHGLIPDKHIKKFINDFILKELQQEKAVYETGLTIIRKWQDKIKNITPPPPTSIQHFITHGSPINANLVERFVDIIKNYNVNKLESSGLPQYMQKALKESIDTPESKQLIKNLNPWRKICLNYH